MYQQSTPIIIMDLQLFIIQLFIYCVGFCVDCLSLSPKFIDIWQNFGVTFYCTNHLQYFSSVGWHINGKIVAIERKGNMCKAFGFLNDQTMFSYSCPNNDTFSVTIKNISREWHGGILKCLDNDLNESNAVRIFVKVPVQNATIFPRNNFSTAAENDTLSFRCISSQCRPKPTFIWYTDYSTDSTDDDILLWADVSGSDFSNMIESFTSTLNYTFHRSINGRFLFCVANNGLEDKIISDKILLDITYPPDTLPRIAELEKDGEFRVIEGNYASLTCSVSGGNPLPQLEWSRSGSEMQTITGSTVTKALSWRTSRVDEDILTCTSIHLYENQTTTVNITVLFPPEKPTITMRYRFEGLLKLNYTIDVIEKNPFTINCLAISNPPVSLFKWFGLQQNTASSTFFGEANRSHTEAICHVFNQMKESNSDHIVMGTNSTSLKVNVMYPPKVNMKKDEKMTIQEGENFFYLCNVTHGNPSATKVHWNWADKAWDGQNLVLQNVSRNQTGVYQCCAQNWMVSTDGIETGGNDCVKIQLYVEYKAKVLNLFANKREAPTNITISENDALNISCELEGNPIPKADIKFQMAIFIRNKLVEENKIIRSMQTSSNLRLTTTMYANCTDAGQYTCTGWNILHNGLKTVSNRSITLFVKCKPRMSPFHEISAKVYSAMSGEVTLSFTALAYPVPQSSGYTWYMESEDGIFKAINISLSDKITISTFGLQSNLSIRNLTKSDYGLYKVVVENDIGKFQHTFNLVIKAEDSQKDTIHVISTVGGAAGGIIVLIVVFVTIVGIRKSFQRSQSCSLRVFRYANDAQVNQSFSQDDTAHSPLGGRNPNVYEELQNADGANYSVLDVGRSNMYEELQNPGRASYSVLDGGKPDTYEEIQTPGMRRQYENLQLAPIKEAF